MMRAKRRGFGWLLAAVAAAGAWTLTSCADRLFVAPAQGIPVAMALSLTPSAAVLGADASACARADQAHVRIVQSGSVLDTTLTVSDACNRPISLQVRLNAETATLQVSVALLANGNTLFQGSSTLRVQTGKQTDAEVPVVPVPAGLIAPDSLRTFTKLGDSLKLGGAVVFATGDTVEGLQPTWSHDGKGIVVVANGFARAQGEGSAVLTASYQGMSHSTAVGVKAVVASVAITGVTDSVSMYLGDTRTFAAVARDSNRNVLRRTIAWTSGNVRVATIDTGGVVRAVGAGTALIVAAAEAKADSFTVTVGRQPVARVVVTPGYAVLNAESEQLTATTYDAAGNVLMGRAVSWASSDPKVATVTQTGLVTAVSGGSATISATSEGISGYASIRVMDQPILVVNPAQASLVFWYEAPDTTAPPPLTLQVTNAGGGTITGLTATIGQPAGTEAPQYVESATLASTTAPTTLTLRFVTSMYCGLFQYVSVTVSSTTAGTKPVVVPVTYDHTPIEGTCVFSRPAPIQSVTPSSATATARVARTANRPSY